MQVSACGREWGVAVGLVGAKAHTVFGGAGVHTMLHSRLVAVTVSLRCVLASAQLPCTCTHTHPPGQELTVSYLGREDFAPAGARQAVLQERFGFECDCQRCRCAFVRPLERDGFCLGVF